MHGSPTHLWPWLVIAALGAYHGLNPAMGWLFAVALAMQEKRCSAAFRALPPIALGHAASVALVIVVVLLLQQALPLAMVKVIAALILLSFGAYRLFRSNHPGRIGMQVGFADLTAWSFVMASACGAGLMLMPVLLAATKNSQPTFEQLCGAPSPVVAPIAQARAFPLPALSPHLFHFSGDVLTTPQMAVTAITLHTLGHLLTAGVIALLVFRYLGLSFLARAWFNLDLLWVMSLMLSGIAVLFV